jgi:basic amino acid/polyamine antiporter, APA family
MIGVGSIVGAGIFVMVGQAAALYAGPAVLISLCLSGACCFLYALCYCELASFIHEGGSAYSYAREAFGLQVAWFVAWNLILEYIFGAAAIAIGWSGYFCSVLRNVGIIVPNFVTDAALAFPTEGGIQMSGSSGNLPAVLITVLCTCVLAVGVEESAKVNNIVVGIKISVLLLFILGGMWYIKPENYEPFLPSNTGKYGEYGLSGVFRASSVMLFAYIGFDAVSTCAAEAVAPERTVPLGILGLPSRTRAYTHAYHCCSDAPDTRQHGPSARSKPSTFSNHIVCVLASVHRAPHRPPTT